MLSKNRRPSRSTTGCRVVSTKELALPNSTGYCLLSSAVREPLVQRESRDLDRRCYQFVDRAQGFVVVGQKIDEIVGDREHHPPIQTVLLAFTKKQINRIFLGEDIPLRIPREFCN